MCLKDIKQFVMVPCMILLGSLRLLGFVFALTALVSNFLGVADVPNDLIKGNLSAYGFIQGWKWIAKGIETSVCILVMADTVVTTDGPFGKHIGDNSFLYVLKIPPALSRSLLWVIMLVIPCSPLQLFLMRHYGVSNTATIIFLLNSGRKLMIIPVAIYLIVCVFRYWGDFVRSIDHTTGSSDHWHIQRYYEHSDFPKPHRLKQKVEKAIMIFVCLLAIAGHVFNIVAFVSDLPSITNSATNATVATRAEVSTRVISFPNIFSISMSIPTDLLYYLDFIGKVCIFLLFSVLLVIYFIFYLCMSTFLPVHTTVKIFHFYNFLSALPSNAAIAYIVTPTTGVSISSNTSLWIFALLPFIFFLQALPYILTRKIYQLLTDLASFLKVIYSLFGELAQLSKLYRFFHCITIIIGVCGFIFLLMGIPLYWIRIDFQPDINLSKLFDLNDALRASIQDILFAFNQALGCVQVPGGNDNITLKLNELKREHKDCFDSNTQSNQTYCEALAEGVSSASSVESTHPKDCLTLDECLVYIPLMLSGIALANVPFLGPVGTVLLKTASVGRKLIRLAKKFKKAIKKFKKLLSVLKAFKLLFKRPIATKYVVFNMDTYMLVFFLPCLLVGIISVSVGFWGRDAISSGRLKINRAYILFLIFGSNSVTMIFAFLYKHVLKTLIDALPLMTAEITELLGWHLVKAALLCSTLASFFMWIYSIGDVVLHSPLCKCLSTQQFSHERTEMSTRSKPEFAPKSKTLAIPANDTSLPPCQEHKTTRTSSKVKNSTTLSKNKQTLNETSSLPSSNDKNSTAKDRASTTSKDNPLTQSKDNIVSETSGDSSTTVQSPPKSRLENTPLEKGLPTTQIPSLLYNVTGNINLTRVWLMALFPVAFAVIVMLISFSTADTVFTIHPRFTERMGKMLTKLHESCGLLAQIFKDANEEGPLCDIVTKIARLALSTIYSALKSSTYDAILEYDNAVLQTLVLPKAVIYNNFKHLFNIPVAVAICLYGFGFVLSLVPRLRSRNRSWLLRLKRLICLMIYLCFKMKLLVDQYLQATFIDIPMLELTVVSGPTMHYFSIALLFLLFAFIELTISEYCPLKL